MKTLEDAMFENSGAAQVAHIDHDEMAAQVAAGQTATQPVDRRTAVSVAHELRNIEGNYVASEEDRKKAERDVNNLTGAHAQLSKVLAGLRKHPSAPRVQSTIAEMQKKLEEVEHNLNNPRNGAKAALDAKTRIAASRKKLLEDFLAARPFKGAQTNNELLQEDRELQKLIEEAKSIDTTVSQPSVGVPMLRAE
jgi:hypothetical protein